MNEDAWLSIVYLTAALVLVSSNFWGRRVSMGKAVQLALVWLGIFLIAFVIVDNRHRILQAIGMEEPAVEPVDSRYV